MKDAKRLGEMYLRLQKEGAELFEIMERHPELIETKKCLSEAMLNLSNTAHKIYEQAHKLKEEEKE